MLRRVLRHWQLSVEETKFKVAQFQAAKTARAVAAAWSRWRLAARAR